MTTESLALFLGLAEDAGDWSGEPFVDITAANRGNLTDLKRKGLIETNDDGEGNMFVRFTDDGVKFAGEHGIDLSWTRW